MKETFVQQCLDILKRDDVKNEIKVVLRPLTDFIFTQINPYIYITVILVFYTCNDFSNLGHFDFVAA